MDQLISNQEQHSMSANMAVSENSQTTRLLEESRSKLLTHPLYEAVRTADGLRIFMREHAFAVWDFMSLLKRLQLAVTCCQLPWLPASHAQVARFINEIVLGEECDEDGMGGYASHFELYLSAMNEIGADSVPIREFTANLRNQASLDDAFAELKILPTTKSFVRSTMQIALHGKPHEVAAAFFYGREDIIPEMFTRLVASLPHEGVPVQRMSHYLNRHIELDSSNHGPRAARLLDSLCGHDPQREQEATQAAIRAISQRISLWDGLLAAIHSKSA